jgi:hypothetical protein
MAGRGAGEVFRRGDYRGREVVLTDARWYGKILLDHVVLAPHLNKVEQTLSEPLLVRDDLTWPDVENFYRRFVFPGPIGRIYLKVSVRFTDSEGYVLTAYPTKWLKQGEMQLWPAGNGPR